jgi:hypothetical protein
VGVCVTSDILPFVERTGNNNAPPLPERLRNEGFSLTGSLRALISPSPISFAQLGTNPQRIIVSRWLPSAASRITGTSWVGATL